MEDPLAKVRQLMAGIRMSSLKTLPSTRRAQVIQSAQEMFAEESVASRIGELGLGPDVAQMFDTANTIEGLDEEDRLAEQRRLEEQAMIAKFVPMSYVPGMEERVVKPAIQGVQDMASGYGIGEGGGEQGEKAWPLVRGAANLVSGMAPYVAATGGLGAIPGIASKLGPATGPAIYSTAFGGLEAARQLGTEGKISDPKALATETVVGAASGMPVGRIAATAMVGGTHAAMGTFEEDWQRAAVDTAFTALFGNPRYDKRGGAGESVPRDVGGERAAGELGPLKYPDFKTEQQRRVNQEMWKVKQKQAAYAPKHGRKLPTEIERLVDRARGTDDPVLRAERQDLAVKVKQAIDSKVDPDTIEDANIAQSVLAEKEGKVVATSDSGQKAPTDNSLEIKNRIDPPDRKANLTHPNRLMWHEEVQKKIQHVWDAIKNSPHVLADRRVAMHLLGDHEIHLSKLHARLENALTQGGFEREVIEEALDMARRRFTGKETRAEALDEILAIETQWNLDYRHQGAQGYTPDQVRDKALMPGDARAKALPRLEGTPGFVRRLSELLHAEKAQGPVQRAYKDRDASLGTKIVDYSGTREQAWDNEYTAIANEIENVTGKMLSQLNGDMPLDIHNAYQAKAVIGNMMDELVAQKEVIVKGSPDRPGTKPVRVRNAMTVKQLKDIRDSVPEHLEKYASLVRQMADERIARLQGKKKPGETNNIINVEEGGSARENARTERLLSTHGEVVELRKRIKEVRQEIATDTFKDTPDSFAAPKPTPESTTPRRSAGPETTKFFELQAKANEYGLKLTRNKRTYELKIAGKTQRYNNIREAEKALVKLEAGRADTPMLLEAAAAKHGIGVEFTGAEYKTHDFISGEHKFHKTFDEARDHVAGKPPIAGKYGEIGPPTGKSVPGIGHPGPASGHMAPPVPNDLMRVGAGFMDSMKTSKTLLDKITEATGWNVNGKVFRGLTDANRSRIAWSLPLGRKLKKSLKGIPRDQHQNLMDVAVALDRGKEAKLRRLNPLEEKAIPKLDDWFMEVLEIDKKGLKSFYDTVRLARKYDGNIELGTPGNRIPAWAAEYLNDLQAGDLALHDKNVMSVATQILYAKGFKKYMSEPVKVARQMRNKMHGESLKLGSTVRGKNLAASLDTIDTFIDGMSNGVHHSAESVAQTLNQIQQFFKQRGLLKGSEMWSKRDVQRLSMEMTSWFSGSAMTFRAALAVRNVFQWMLGIPKVGYGNAWEALKRAMSPEGRAEFMKTNIVTDPGAFGMLDGFRDIGQGMNPSTNPVVGAMQRLREIQSAGMFMYRWADTANRAIAYHQGKIAIEKYAPMLLDKKLSMNEFLLRTGLMGDSSPTRHAIIKEFIDMPGQGQKAGIARAADLYGKEMVEQSQFVYSGANAPKYSQHMIGRFFGQFGLWPTAYAEYMWKNLGFAHALKSGAQGQYHRGFITKYASQLALLAYLGEQTGVQMNTFNRANPFTFEGGPIGQIMSDTWTLGLQSGNEYDRKRAKRNLYRSFQQLLQPFGGITRDQFEAMDERQMYEKVMKAAGFNMMED